MSGFASAAFCFLTSTRAECIIGPNPTTTRGRTTVIGIHPREPKIIFTSGKLVIIRNIENPRDCFVYRGHAYPTTVAKFSPNGYWVASADLSGKVRIWSWDNPEHILRLELAVFAGEVYDLDWDFESKKIVAVGEGSMSMAKVFAWDTGTTTGEISGHAKRILTASFKPCRPIRIMTGGEDFKTIFHTGPPFKLDHSNTTHTNYVNCVKYAPNGSLIVSVSNDKKIQFFDGATGNPTTSIPEAHEGSIYSVAWNPQSTQIATASADKAIKIWEVATLQNLRTLSVSPDPQLGDMQMSLLWNANYLISVSLNGNMNYFTPSTTTTTTDSTGTGAAVALVYPQKVIHSHQVAITSMFYDRNTSQLFTGSYDGVVCSHSIETGVIRRMSGQDKKSLTGSAHSGKVTGITLSEGVLTTVGWDDKMRIADPNTSNFSSHFDLVGQPCGVASSSNSSITVIATNKELAAYRGATKLFTLDKLTYGPTCLDILDDVEVAVGGDDNKTHIYSIAELTGFTPVTTIDTRTPVSAVAYSPLRDAIAIGDNGRQVEVYDRNGWTAKIQGRWVAHTSKISTLAWSPNAAFLASGSLDESIYIWSFASPTSQLQLPFSHSGGVTGVAWINDDRLVSTGNDACVITWKNVTQF